MNNRVIERFWAKVDRRGETECWEWLGVKAFGYGRFHGRREAGRNVTVAAHRFAYQLVVGPIPEGLTIDHLCRNRGCVNPAHLEPVTGAENTLRGVGPTATNARKTRCKRGHPLVGDNVYFQPGVRGRRCYECKRLLQKRRQERDARPAGSAAAR